MAGEPSYSQLFCCERRPDMLYQPLIFIASFPFDLHSRYNNDILISVFVGLQSSCNLSGKFGLFPQTLAPHPMRS